MDLLLYMIDITNRNSFNSIENWINIINERNPPKDGKINYETMIIGNKLDLINENNNVRQVTEEEAKNFCEKNNIIWGGEKSFKDMNKNELEEMMKEFIKKIYNKIGQKKINPIELTIPKNNRRRRGEPGCIIF